MRRAAVLLLFASALTACKSMGSVGSGLGHVANGVGHVASAAGRVASVAGNAVAPVAAGVGKVAAPVARAAVSVAPTVANVALQTAAAATVGNPPVTTYVEPVHHEDLRQDLCLDCPDVGNCASCPADRNQSF